MPMTDPAPMPGAPGAHPAYEPTLEQHEEMDAYLDALERADHARAVLARRGPEPTNSPMQGFELLGGAS